ncbi:Gfo/Idh/MocA family protein [Paenibacillus eucommiae]|uniref:Dehydrogenase n=1 Tax=Paenibacillus eucommiae TaxID=1355755 RepID=A0ABS4IT63_9BACL|nr:Gfo/Idh/MocA family oxidoreductase [Paenibacillus eucommiae]MBP1990759.1 putative dehydrogenase [Paenibacillus eucommiae]
MSVRIGFIGVGGMAKYHIQTLKGIENANIVSVYDVNLEAAVQAAESVGASVKDSADELLDSAAIDAVFICTPQFARGELEETAARRGIHMFVEKPLGLDMNIVQKKAQIIHDSGVINASGYCLRYLDTVRKAKAYLQGRSIHMVQANRYGTNHPAKWWRTLEQSGGHLVDAVTHQVDMIRFVAGEFREVYAKFGRTNIQFQYPDATIYDAGSISFSMDSGAVGSITESCISPYHADAEVKIFGRDFFVHLSNNGTTLSIMDEEQKITETSEIDFYQEQNKTFVNAVASGVQDQILCSFAEGVKTLAVSLAANQSEEEQKKIVL